MNRFLPALLTVALLAGSCFAQPHTWSSDKVPSVTGLVRTLAEEVLKEARIDRDDPTALLTRRGTRSTAYLSALLLMRNEPGDAEFAAAALDELLKWQITDPTHDYSFGNWPKYKIDEPTDDPKIDQNWREFVACGLILIREHFSDRLPAELLPRIDHALLLAAQGAALRDVRHTYTNIAIMSSFLMQYVGVTQNMPELAAQGAQKAEAFNDLYLQCHTFTEYNAPTYDGVSLRALAMWRAMGPTPRMRELGAELEEALWRDIAEHYHVGLRNLVGPYFRAYAIDSTTKHTPTSLWIALLLDNLDQSPLPLESPTKSSEMHEIAFPALLGVQASQQVIDRLRTVPHDLTLQREVPVARPEIFLRIDPDSGGPDRYLITATLQPNWMMGAALGYDGNFNQFVAATLHWMDDQGRVNWIMLPGVVNAAPMVEGSTLTIRRGHCGSKLVLLAYIPDWHPPQVVMDTQWNLPGAGMVLNVTPSAGQMHVQPLPDEDRDTYTRDTTPNLLELSLAVPDDAQPDDVLLTIEVP